MTAETMILKPDRIQAIEAQSDLLKVTGGVGCGKTCVIAKRAQYLLSQGYSPKEIQIIVANRQGVNAITAYSSAEKTVGLDGIAVDTVDSFCIRLLNTEAARRQTGRISRLLNSAEEIFFFEDLKLLGFKPAELRESLKALYDNWANLVETQDPHLVALEAAVARLLKEREAMLPMELPHIAWRYLTDLAEKCDNLRIPHLLVDDYHDLSLASQAIIGLVSSLSITVACDPLLSLVRTSPSVTIQDLKVSSDRDWDYEAVTLREKQRGTRNIITAGNAVALSLMENVDPAIIDKAEESNLLVEPKEEALPGRISLVKWRDPQQECASICTWLKKRLDNEEDGLDAGDVLIVVLNSAFGRQFARQLDVFKIAHEDLYSRNLLRGNPQQLGSSAGMRSYSLLTLAANPNDVVAWRSWCGYGHKQLKSELWSLLVNWASTENMGISEALQRLGENGEEEKPFPQSETLAQAWRSADEILTSVKGKRGHHFLRKLMCGDDASLIEFKQLSGDVSSDDTVLSLYSRISEQLLDPVFTSEKRVRIATPQTAVGLQSSLVIIPGMVDGLLPTEPSSLLTGDDIKGSETQQLERRLFCQTISCTANELVLSYFQKTELKVAERLGAKIRRTRREHGVDMALLSPSQFLDEMGNAVPATEAYLAI